MAENEGDLALLLHALICCVMGSLSRDLLSSFFIFLFFVMTNCLMNESCAIRNCIVDVFLFFD